MNDGGSRRRGITARKVQRAGEEPAFSLTEWQEEGRRLMEAGDRFGLGDWYNKGQARFGRNTAAAIVRAGLLEGLKSNTLGRYARVAEIVPPADRHLEVPFAFYRALLGLPKDQQRQVIQLVKERGAQGLLGVDQVPSRLAAWKDAVFAGEPPIYAEAGEERLPAPARPGRTKAPGAFPPAVQELVDISEYLSLAMERIARRLGKTVPELLALARDTEEEAGG